MSSAVNQRRARHAAPKTIGFKLSDPRLHAALRKLAASRGQSTGQLARDLCLDALRSAGEPAAIVPGLSEQLAELKRLLAQSMFTLLRRSGAAEAEARLWVRRTFGLDDGGGAP